MECKANSLRWLVSNELHCLVSKALLLRPLTRLGLAVRCALAHLDDAANLFCEMDLAMTPPDDGLDWLDLQLLLFQNQVYIGCGKTIRLTIRK